MQMSSDSGRPDSSLNQWGSTTEDVPSVQARAPCLLSGGHEFALIRLCPSIFWALPCCQRIFQRFYRSSIPEQAYRHMLAISRKMLPSHHLHQAYSASPCATCANELSATCMQNMPSTVPRLQAELQRARGERDALETRLKLLLQARRAAGDSSAAVEASAAAAQLQSTPGMCAPCLPHHGIGTPQRNFSQACDYFYMGAVQLMPGIVHAAPGLSLPCEGHKYGNRKSGRLSPCAGDSQQDSRYASRQRPSSPSRERSAFSESPARAYRRQESSQAEMSQNLSGEPLHIQLK